MPPSLGFALLARDASSHLGACLESLRPVASQIVVCVDELTTDNTADVAREHGAEVYSIAVSQWHECPDHGRVLAQHFARARQESFTHLDPGLEWWAWIDSDDVLVGADRLAERLPQIDGEAVGVWLPYEYGTAEKDGVQQVTTVFHRERILRSKHAWRWEGRVHETVTCPLPGPWVGMDDVIIRHQHGIHKTGNSALRNLLLLEIDEEETPNSPRTAFYLGNQYFAMGQWEAAAFWYERLADLPNANPYELWQARCYESMALMKMGNPLGARDAAMAALDVMPQHPEPYFHVGSSYLIEGQWEKALEWINMGRTKKEPPFFVFRNPMDYKFNNRVAMAEILAGMGHLPEARGELEAAYRAFPDDGVARQIATIKATERAADQASAFATMAQALLSSDDAGGPLPPDTTGSGYSIAVDMFHHLPPEVRQFGRARDVIMPAILRHRQGTQPRIVFWCGQGLEEWAPPTINTTGIGGSETAVVEIARLFERDGWLVDVYGNPGRMEGPHDDVGYWMESREKGRADVAVSWRKPDLDLSAFEPRTKLLWCHDLNYGPRENFGQGFDVVLGVSQWHADQLSIYYKPSCLLDFVPNGIRLERFDRSLQKMPFRAVYASSPDRGLAGLLEMWPRITEAEPTAELHVAYGWENYDKWIAAGHANMAAFKQAIMQRIERTPGVVWRGRLSQADLARLYCESRAWLYPTTFLEVSCCTGDTLVDMPRNYLEHPKGIPIKDLAGKSNFPVWSFNEETGQFVLSRVKWVARTGVNREVWCVNWDDGTSLRATPDHKVLTYKRGWVALQDLMPGESVVALKKHVAIAVSVGNGPWEYEHRHAAQWALGHAPGGYHTDHIDGNPFNNDPLNMQYLSPSEHATKTFTGKLRTHQSDRVRIASWKERWASDTEFREGRIANLRAQGSRLWEWVNGLTPSDRAAWLKQRAAKKRASMMAGSTAPNHKVLSVKLDGYEDVYDMEVEDTHNFVAGGVVIHNCISAMEAMAGGAAVVTARLGALPETVSDAGILVEGYPQSAAWREFYAHIAVAVLMSPNIRQPLRFKGYARAEQLTWDRAYEKWRTVVNRLLAGKSEEVLA